jgi:hypothetical protein
MANPLNNLLSLKVPELGFIPFKSNFQQVESVEAASGQSPDGPTPSSYDFTAGNAIHNPYIRPFFHTTTGFTMPSSSSFIQNIIELDFSEFISNLSGTTPSQVLYSTMRVIMFHRLTSQSNWLRQKTIIDVYLTQQITTYDYYFQSVVIAQGPIADTNRAQNNINLSPSISSTFPTEPKVSIRITGSNPLPFTLSNQRIITKGLIKYIG